MLVSSPPAAADPGDCWGAAVATLDDGTTVKVCAINPVSGPTANAFHDVLGNTIGFFRDVNLSGPLWMYPNYSDGRKISFTGTNNNSISSFRSRLTNPGNHVGMHASSGCTDLIDYGIAPDVAVSYPNGWGDSWSCLDYAG